ncbi:hypothetical protein PTKIN_Ptkin09bG0263100 [Pterospermum kingtungense]
MAKSNSSVAMYLNLLLLLSLLLILNMAESRLYLINSRCKLPSILIGAAKDDNQEAAGVHHSVSPVVWCPSSPGSFKLNVDASFEVHRSRANGLEGL